jgi:hypothetical protein
MSATCKACRQYFLGNSVAQDLMGARPGGGFSHGTGAAPRVAANVRASCGMEA